MSLVDLREKRGNLLFKYRSYFPILIFFLSIPFLYNMHDISNNQKIIWNYISVFFTILGFSIRFYTIGTTTKGTSGRNREKQIADQLNSTGIYSIIRHPLYVANYFIWVGITIFTYNLYFIIIISLFFWIYYREIIFVEERFLEKKFHKKYLDWSNRVPRFLPLFKTYVRTTIIFSLKSILRREYSSVLSAVIAFSYIDILRIFFKTNHFGINNVILNVLIITIIIAIILKSLKYYTNLLYEIDRS